MENIDKMQATFENFDKLALALIPFVSSDKQNMLRSIHNMLEPMKHLKDIMQTMEMVNTIQQMMSSGENDTPDLSMLSGLLNPEQMQMFEAFQAMQDVNL